MTVKLRCAATGDLVLLSATAKDLLGLLAKPADQAGIIEPEDMPGALAILKALPSSKPSPAETEDDARPSFSDETVSLHQRAWPLIQMLERAHAAGKPIVWGV